MHEADIIDEHGVGIADKTRRAILTGSSRDGVSLAGPVNCSNWTNSTNADNGAEVGRTDAESIAVASTTWNKSYIAQCSEAGMRTVESEGRIYCFAPD